MAVAFAKSFARSSLRRSLRKKTRLIARSLLLLLVLCTAEVTGVPANSFELGPERLVSTNADGGYLRCEPAVAAAENDIVIAWNDSYGGQHGSPTGVAVGWALSKDRGKSFAFGGYLPEQPQGPIPSGGDPVLLVDRQGNFILAIVSWQDAKKSLLFYEMKKDRRGDWQYLSAFSSELVDRPSMVLDDRGHLWVSFSTTKHN